VKIKNEKDFWSGVMFLAIGLAFVVFSRNYDFGTAQRMGPAYFPTVLGGVMIVLGLIIVGQGLAVDGDGHGKVDKFHFGPVAWVLGAIIFYGAILLKAGLMLSMVALIVISMYGSHEFKWKEAAGVAIVMGGIVYGVFVYGLKLTIPVWPAIFGG
jgi:hypothetical protein